MRCRFASLLAVIFLTATAHAEPQLASISVSATLPPSRTLKVRTTAYTHTEADHLEHGIKTSSGTTLRAELDYTSAAADWSRFPVGTIFYIKGSPTLYVVDDYGRALAGTDTIDIYRPTKSAMNEWGVRKVDIEILSFGSVERSLELLARRQHYPHCRKMYDALKALAK